MLMLEEHLGYVADRIRLEQFKGPDRIPCLSEAGRARMRVLSYCDGERTAREIEAAVLRDHPDLFPSPEAISRFVAQALGWDTE